MNIKQGILILLLLLRVTSVNAQFYTVASVSNIDHFDKRELFFETSFKTVKNILTKYPTNTISLEESYNGLFYKLLSLAIHYNKFEKAKEYSLKVKPKNYKEFIKCMCAKNYVMFRLLYLVVK